MHTNSGRSLAVRVGALTAALSLMFAGGVAMASTAAAKPNPDKGNSSNAPGQQSADGPNGNTTNDPNGGAVHGDNGGANTPGNNQNGSNGKGGTGTLSIDVCHATRSANNPYVFITVDFSSVDEAYLFLSSGWDSSKGGGNGHGDHVGAIWDGQRSGVNWGDIIESISGVTSDGKSFTYDGYNLESDSAALGGKGKDILANGCKGLKPLPAYLCVIATGATATFPDGVDSQAYKDAVAQTTVYSTSSPCKKTTECVDGVSGTYQPGNLCNPPGGFSAEATSGFPLCVVTNDTYTGITSVPAGPIGGTGATQDEANANAQANADNAAVVKARENANGNNIIKPFKLSSGASFEGYNWNDKTEARYNAGCSPNQAVISAVTLPATIPASGKPAPAKTPASATLPGSVPAGDGSSAPVLPLWALAMVIVGALGAAAAGSQLLGNRK